MGYAAFNTNLNITAKGNIKAKDITDDIVTTGDGLYKDAYEDGRYIYRGNNPDNYIWFNDELWRIIAKEADGTYKIIRNELLANRAFDEPNHRLTASNTYCQYPEYGCGVYAKIDGIFYSEETSQSGTVTEDSSIKIYLNNDYYINDINSAAKEQMTTHLFNIGEVAHLNDVASDSIEKNIDGEKKYTWTGNVGLANVSDILRASTNPLCTSASTSYDNTVCNSNYLLVKETANYTGDRFLYWTINAFSYAIDDPSWNGTWAVNNDATSQSVQHPQAYRDYIAPRPVVFLKTSTKLSGSGTKENPFRIIG